MVDLENQHTNNSLKYQDREHSAELVSLHSRLHFNTTICKYLVRLRMTVRSDQFFYKQAGNPGMDIAFTETKGELVVEMTGKYDFTVTCEVIEMMEAENNVIVNWSYNYQVVKGSSDKYNLNKNYVKVLRKRLCSFIGTIVTGFTKATITSTLGERTEFYAYPSFQ
jgi:hypothetical protein